MIRRIWLIWGAIVLLAVAPGFVVSAQDTDEPIDEIIEEYNIEYEEELLPVLSTAAEYGSLETLLELIRQSGLDKELQGAGPYTLMAPDDSAFAQLKPEQFERLSSDREYLKQVLSRHIIKGQKVVFGVAPQVLTLTSLNGDELIAEVTDDAVLVEQAIVIDEEIECNNGVIHVIETVLLPPEGQQKG
ncbi:MAG: fasciclin domain-containing protein [Candidatus Zixiibacteriota bacterium]